MEHFPTLQTKNLLLRELLMSDLPSLALYLNNPKISTELLNIPHPYTKDDAIKRYEFISNGFKNKERYVFSICLKGTNDLIGQMGLHLDNANNRAEIGYWIAENFWGRGIASEAMSAVLQFGFENLKLKKIYATHYPENPASGKIMIKNKMVKEGELKDHYLMNGQYRSIIQYRLTDQEYFSLNHNQ